jgi:excinuclease ABC subunit C
MPRVRFPFERDRLKTYPRRPGVYFMKNAQGGVLYVGKAKNLQGRLRSYFQKPSRLAPKVFDLMRQVTDIDVQVVGSELEALLLEAHFIKTLQPFFNRKIKHYQHLLFLKVTIQEPAPCLQISLETDDPAAIYYGPFSSRSELEMKRDIINRVFRLRSCNDQQFAQHYQNPCTQFQIGLCAGPCSDKIAKGEYQTLVHDFINYMAGSPCNTVELLTAKRDAYCDALLFEKAAQVQASLEALEALQLRHYQRLQAIEQHHCIIVLPAVEPRAVRLLAVLHGLPHEWRTFSLDAPDWPLLAQWVHDWMAEKERRRPTSIPKDLYEEARLISQWLQQEQRDGWVVYLQHHSVEKALDDLRCVLFNEPETTDAAEWE